MTTYVFKCGHKSPQPVHRDSDHSRSLVCPKCGERVDHIITYCQICKHKIINPAGRTPKQKCGHHTHFVTQEQAARLLGVSVSTVVRLHTIGDLVPNGRARGRKVLTKVQVHRYREKIEAEAAEGKAPEMPGCDKYNCAHRTDCLGTPQFYQPCERYRCEYEAEDFCGVKFDLYDRARASAPAGV